MAKKTTELVLFFHKNITKLVFLWPNMSQKKLESDKKKSRKYYIIIIIINIKTTSMEALIIISDKVYDVSDI